MGASPQIIEEVYEKQNTTNNLGEQERCLGMREERKRNS